MTLRSLAYRPYGVCHRLDVGLCKASEALKHGQMLLT